MKQRYYVFLILLSILSFQAHSQTFDFGFGSVGTADGQFDEPGGIAFAANGNVYVADRTNNRVQVFSSTGTFITKFGTFGTGSGEFSRPTAIAISPSSGDIYVVERNNHRISVFNSAHVFQFSFGSQGSGNGEFEGPIGIALGTGDRVYIVDRGNHRVQKFNKNGNYQGQFGSFGSGSGQFNVPSGIAIAPNTGNLYVVDRGNHRIQYFDDAPSPTYAAFGSFGTGNGQFDNPARITVTNQGSLSANGQVYVTDFENDRIQVFDLTGTFLFKFGTFGMDAGSFDGPSGIAIQGALIWIAEANNNRVQVFFDNTLPVEYLDFRGDLANRMVNLSWITARETNNSHFVVQRKYSTDLWEDIGSVKGMGTTEQTSTYSYTDAPDRRQTGWIAYRLKQVDLDGKFSYSKTVEINLADESLEDLLIYPSPTRDFAWVEAKVTSRYRLAIRDSKGSVIIDQTGANDHERLMLQIDLRDYPAGVYHLTLMMEGRYYTRQFIKQ